MKKEKKKTMKFHFHNDYLIIEFILFFFRFSSYGKPVEGSKTEARGKQAAQLIANEIKLLTEIITKHGKMNDDDGMITIKFKELFELYKVISSKVVGLLIRARKYNLVKFEGEMLYQGRDDNVIITLDPNVKLDEIQYD